MGQSNRKVWKKEKGVDMGNKWDWVGDGGGGVRWEVNGFEGEIFFFFFFLSFPSLPGAGFWGDEVCYRMVCFFCCHLASVCVDTFLPFFGGESRNLACGCSHGRTFLIPVSLVVTFAREKGGVSTNTTIKRNLGPERIEYLW